MTIRILTGDCRDVLKTLPDASVQCCVTSPPYYGLRDYGTAQWEGGDAGCDHKGDARYYTEKTAAVSSAGAFSEAGQANADRLKVGRWREGGVCTKCGAKHQDAQIGLEQTPAEYVAQLVEVFREVRRVLRDDGTLWLNLGDSYANDGKWGGETGGKQAYLDDANRMRVGREKRITGLKPKDLIGIPWMVAFALRDDGWWLRSDIIWAKRNCMPESVRDRPTRAHEYIFLLSKRERYFYDAVAIEEEGEIAAGTRAAKGSDVRSALKDVNGRPPEYYEYTGKRNKRSVWHIATRSFPDAHFATFPPDLIEPCIKAGTSERGCCSNCGAPWGRQVDRTAAEVTQSFYSGAGQHGSDGRRLLADRPGGFVGAATHTTGWLPSCRCNADVVPCTVLDPFGGAGTTALVADRLGRDTILIELNPAYADMARNRMVRDAGLFAEVADAPVPTDPQETRIADLFAEPGY